MTMRIFCAIALMLFGLADHAVAGQDDWRSADYRLPDGSYAALCQPGTGQGDIPQGGGPQGRMHQCGSCVLAAGQVLEPPAVTLTVPVGGASETISAPPVANLTRIRSHHAQSRGPPLSA